MRKLISGDPFAHLNASKSLWNRNTWPARWVSHMEPGQPPFVVAYRRVFEMPRQATIQLHVSADERYRLELDGKLLGRGSERGDADHWYFETYQVTLPAGKHTLLAKVWSLGAAAPYAQISIAHGLMVACDDEFLPLIATGVAAWEARLLPGHMFTGAGHAWGTGSKVLLDGESFVWDLTTSEGWTPAVAKLPGATLGRMEQWPTQVLTPATLPAMIDRPAPLGKVRFVEEIPPVMPGTAAKGPSRVPLPDLTARRVDLARDILNEREEIGQRLGAGDKLKIPVRTSRRIIIDLENYYCAYPVITASGGKGGAIRLHWAESLFESTKDRRKGNRNRVDGKYFDGVGDIFLPDGGENRVFETLWWEAGRYLELYVSTADQPMQLSLELRETRYPLEMESKFESPDANLAAAIPIMVRGLQMCAHETYMDCPYYEQLMYVGDTRLELLTTYCLTRDDRLPKKAIAMFESSRLATGLTQSRYPCRVRQVIPPFALWWVAMVYDYAMWRGDAAFVRGRLPIVRGVIDAYCASRNAEGLVSGPATGWNFTDWVPAWKNGVPPDGAEGATGPINWQFALILRLAQGLEEKFGDPELAQRCGRLGGEMARAIHAAFFDESRSLYADDRGRSKFSEHSQCLAILSGGVTGERLPAVADALLTDDKLERTTIYFTHYLFETCRALATMGVKTRVDPIAKFFERLTLWADLKKYGFVTTFEMPEPSRSDCHAWGAHPLYHCFATILGIRPIEPGLARVEVLPQLGALEHATGKLPHPGGFIEANLRRKGAQVTGTILLPENVTGVFGPSRRELKPGRNEV